MKELRNKELRLAGLGFAGGVILTIGMTNIIAMDNEITRLENTPKQQVFVWNDDEESIPPDGEPVMLEFTEGDIMYIGPMEYDPTQYQFFTVDDSVKVYDYNRYVGTIKLDGTLKTLIDQDNQ